LHWAITIDGHSLSMARIFSNSVFHESFCAIKSHISYSLYLAPFSGRKWGRTRTSFTINDPSFLKIIWGHFDAHLIAGNGADPATTHSACGVSYDACPVFQPDAETAIWQNLVDLPFEGESFLFGHRSEHPTTGYGSERETSRFQKEAPDDEREWINRTDK
jgi:hypothetical protein